MTIQIDPIGLNDYRGLAVPTYGESAIRQQNSSNAILTLMHSSLNTGGFMMGMDHTGSSLEPDPVDSSRLTNAMWDIDADGHYRVLSGTTVYFRVGPNGLYAGGNSSMLIDAAKGYQINTQRVTTVAAATTNVAVTSADSGVLYLVSSDNSTCQFNVTATPPVGMYFDIFCDTTAAGDQTVMTDAAGDAQGFKWNISTADFVSTAGITNVTSGVWYTRFTAISSGSLWLVEPLWIHDGSTTIMGNPANASTST